MSQALEACLLEQVGNLGCGGGGGAGRDRINTELEPGAKLSGREKCFCVYLVVCLLVPCLSLVGVGKGKKMEVIEEIENLFQMLKTPSFHLHCTGSHLLLQKKRPRYQQDASNEKPDRGSFKK
jgi:hypothetical protein